MTKGDSFPKLSDGLRQDLKKDRNKEKKSKKIVYPFISLLVISIFIFGLWKISFNKGLTLKEQTTPGPKIQSTPKLTPTPASTPTPTPEPTSTPTPEPTTETYTVVDGDTLSTIAEKFGVSVSAIAETNGLEEPYFLSVGDKLVIPR